MHADETRDPRQIDDLRREDALTHFDEFWTKYLGMAARSTSPKGSAKGKDAETNKREAERARAALAAQKSQLAQANAALAAYRVENKRLKDDLKRLRGSRTWLVGRWALHPLAMVKQRASATRRAVGRPSTVATAAQLASTASTPPPAAPSQSAPTISNGPPAHRSATAAAPGSSSPRPTATSTGTSNARELQLLVTALDADPTPANLLDVLQYGWNVGGHVSEVCAALRRHSELVGAMGDWGQALAARALGDERIITGAVVVPPRSPGAAYHPERGRIMYCAHSTPAFHTNGYSTRTGGIVSALRSGGNDVTVVARAGYPWDTKTEAKHPRRKRWSRTINDVEYVHLPGPDLTRTPLDHYLLQAADAYVREARLQRPSLIHAASNHRTALPALIAARRLGLPFVYEVRGLWEITEASDRPGFEGTERYEMQVSLENLVLTEADAVLAITEELRDELVVRGVDPARIRLAPNAVHPHEFLPLPKDEAYAARHGIPLEHPVIGFAGSLVTYEGLATLLDAAALLRDRGREFTIAIAGSGKAEADLAKQVTRLGLSDRVRLLGRLPNAEMPRLLSLFDIMPLPRLSLPVTEMVSPLKPLEALSSAKAVVLSDVKPHRIYAGADDPTAPPRGLLVPAGDPVGLADALADLIDDPDRRADLGRAGRQWCLRERTWDVVAAQVRQAHTDAGLEQQRLADATPARSLSDLRVGLIADEFTSQTLAASMQTQPLDRHRWADQLAGLDLVFIESAWKGNHGQWFRGVGRYEDDEHADIAALLSSARERGIPTVFWNKEDPVHFARFVDTAALCDHVFTTDADMIGPYLRAGLGTVRTASALPFYAQPRIHNPLARSRTFEPTVAYAGTFYGDRYKKRSAELASLLTTAEPFGLTIYDRQADDPDSPYRFPASLQPFVRGSLPYDEVIDAYSTHLANLNVNSVSDSPSMFSRRVVEIAACGGVVLSGPGRGIEETFGSAIPVSADPLMWRAWLGRWSRNPQARLAEAWLQVRSVLRAHTVASALTILTRTAGLSVEGVTLATYALDIRHSDPALALRAVAQQSVLPRQVMGEVDQETHALLAELGIEVVPRGEATADYVGILDESTLAALTRTWFEDLLLSNAYGPWERIEPAADEGLSLSSPLATPTDAPSSSAGLVARVLVDEMGLDGALHRNGVTGVRLTTMSAPPHDSNHGIVDMTDKTAGQSLEGRTVLVAGHDLKFATALITSLEQAGATVLTDVWQSHTKHDEATSLQLLAQADVVLCEWGLGNAVWYSKHVSAQQRLVVRVHSQELRRPYLSQIRHAAVDRYVFVGELIRQAAIRSHGVPAHKAVVIPNPVDVDALDLPKLPGAKHTIGFVGIVPQTKRLDRAIEVVERLRDRGHDHRLRIKGKRLEDHPWMAQRPDEMKWYAAQQERIDRLNEAAPGTVVFDGHGDDMPQWYRSIGVVLSTSDFESFHLTIADGAASGALPVTVAWSGADLIYPAAWIEPTVDEMVEHIIAGDHDVEAGKAFVRAHFAQSDVLAALRGVLAG
ncbi:glycosyltransferase [Aestuariimicrobium sp. T2.26MG-19.2B]|uniref:glycosyltransferase n=1 Tax=Aestuariimicrobium sp. T2.26MG-19.2B TaxID=3040679 RepID=UPI0024775FAA|nr:glycosyltransferase [Aestuariimicrobium sp. T2.26MG-19.2B]CAI9406324.1 D-inositol-3-phosphate glycosyltransferase [Aestuariimicrobium sp. T2.26MG-19.2B]